MGSSGFWSFYLLHRSNIPIFHHSFLWIAARLIKGYNVNKLYNFRDAKLITCRILTFLIFLSCTQRLFVVEMRPSLSYIVIAWLRQAGSQRCPVTRNPLNAGPNSLLRASTSMCQGLSQVGHHATGGYELRQIREEAAVSNAVCVVGWLRPNYDGLRCVGKGSMKGAQPSSMTSRKTSPFVQVL